MSRQMSMVVTYEVPDEYTQGELQLLVRETLQPARPFKPANVTLTAVHKPVVDQR